MLSRFCQKIKPPRCRWLTLPAGNFQYILDDVGETCKPYMGQPLAEMSPSRRGFLLEQLGQKLLERSQPFCKLEDAGRDAPWDFTIDGKKAEFKSAQLAFEQGGNKWGVTFRNVKFAHPEYRDTALFDELYLMIYSPAGLHLLRHDLQTKISSQGMHTGCSGHKIHVAGRSGDGWSAGLRCVLDKLTQEGSCKLLTSIKASDPILRDLLTSHQMNHAVAYQSLVYQGVPLSNMNPSLRGLRVQRIAQSIDQMVHPGCTFLERAVGNRPADWIRDGVRVEVKHAQMVLSSDSIRFRCVFSSIKPNLFDELWLVIYSPVGLHIFKHHGSFCLSSAGARSDVAGRNIWIVGPANQRCPIQALQAMKQKLQTGGCEGIAEVLW
ncbi:unnamed protein product [Effrenium voratum]|uniref:Uncharacterized protein n=1 Tax=Effrenium voratum TaxID=2562239 RepID=A0AA36HY83_9DINO|nr:unnamed protein product [Effrenium voratum]